MPPYMQETVERETKWDVDERFTLPKLDDIVAGGDIDHDTVDLVSAYYDTTERDLQAYGITLRRRNGDADTGWQLKIPTTEGRTELRWVLSDSPPAELTNILTGITLGKELVNVATIHTVRERYRLSEPTQSEACAEVVDDHVRASIGDRLLAWREIEVELGEHTPAPPEQLITRLIAAGAQPSRYASKLAHAWKTDEAEESRSPAARTVAGYLMTQIDQIVAGDIGLRRAQDPIHDTRVATRRVRSTLRVFSKVLDSTAVGELDAELKWFAGLLGEVRDCQVQQRRFSSALDKVPDEMVLGPVRSRIRNDLNAIELPARARVTEAMKSDRYLAIMAALRHWRSDPPLAASTTEKKLRKRAGHAARKAERRLTAAIESGDGAMLHRARKAAKRARYAGELMLPIAKSGHTKSTIERYKRIQKVLGDHQDTVVASAALRRIASAAGTAGGENGFTYGLLYAREQVIATDRRRKVRKLL
jgi:CHAD domain-containing protein